jgi:hypothetical protein
MPAALKLEVIVRFMASATTAAITKINEALITLGKYVKIEPRKKAVTWVSPTNSNEAKRKTTIINHSTIHGKRRRKD